MFRSKLGFFCAATVERVSGGGDTPEIVSGGTASSIGVRDLSRMKEADRYHIYKEIEKEKRRHFLGKIFLLRERIRIGKDQ